MGLMKKLTSAIVASSLVLSLVGTAFAAYTPAAGETAGNRMQALSIIQGKPGLGLDLNGEITRAELVTVIVRAFGQEENAKLLVGAAAYPDSASHWASGNIAMAKALIEKQGETMGMPDGTFAPDAKLTPAQAVAFLMKFLGVKADAAKAWPANFLDNAVAANIITAEDSALIAPMLNSNATRGLVFYMFDRAFYTYDLGAGKTFYTKYVDPSAPVITLTAVEPTTLDSKITISGKVEGATEVYVGTEKVTLDASGNFSYDYNLPELKEYAITVTAKDLAGNVKEAPVTVTRTVGTVATVEAAAITVAAGATVDVAAVAKDAKGNAVPGVAITGESTVGTFADGKFTAATTAGTGTLTLKAGDVTANVNVTINAGPVAKVVPSAENVKVGQQVTLTAQDQYGNAITGATFAQDSADALLDGLKGVFVASKEGNYTITATKDGVTATGTVGVYSTTVKKVVVSGPATVVGNSNDADSSFDKSTGDASGSVYEVTVKAVDANGNLVANYGRAITLNVPAGFYAADDSDATVDGVAKTITKDATNGVATFKVYASYMNVGRAYQFGAVTTLADTTEIGGTDTTEQTKASVEIVEQIATSVKFDTTSTAKYLRANDSTDTTTAKVFVADQNGKRYLETNGYVVNLAVTGPATFAVDTLTGKTSATTTYAGTSKTVTLSSITGRTGAVTLTASVDGLGTATATVTAAVAEDAAKVALTTDVSKAVAADVEAITYKLQVTDANGVPVARAVTLKGSFANDSGELTQTAVSGTFTNWTVDTTNDVTTFDLVTTSTGYAEFTLKAYAFVGDLKLTVKDNDSTVSIATIDNTVSFVADVPAEFGLTRVDPINVGTVSPNTSLSVQLYDIAGNKAAVAGRKITFTSSSDVKFNGTAEKLEVTTDANGVATVNVAVLAYVGNLYNVTVTSTDTTPLNSNGDNAIAIEVVNAVASTLTYTLTDATTATVTRVTAGEAITVTVTAKDAAGKPVTGDSLYFVPNGTVYTSTAYSTKVSKTDGIALNDIGNGKYSITVYPAAAGTLTFTLKDTTSSTVLEQSGSMRVVAAAANKLVVNGGNDIKVAEGKESGAITLTLTDRFGNAVATSTPLEVLIEDGTTNNLFPGIGIRTSVNAANVTKLTIPAGQSSTTFYVWNSLAKSTYLVTFDGTTFSGTANVVVE